MSTYRRLCWLCALAVVFVVAACSAFAQPQTIGDLLPVVGAQQSDLSIFMNAVQITGIITPLQGCGPFTVFAPVDCAWARLTKPTYSELVTPCNKAILLSILMYHVVQGSYSLCDLQNMKCPGVLKTINGGTVTITQHEGSVYVNNSKILSDGVAAQNGTIFKIDMVMVPPGVRVDYK